MTYKLLSNGAFIAGDNETGHTGYAYQTSEIATLARRNPERAAATMLNAVTFGSAERRAEYDAYNWTRLA